MKYKITNKCDYTILNKQYHVEQSINKIFNDIYTHFHYNYFSLCIYLNIQPEYWMFIKDKYNTYVKYYPEINKIYIYLTDPDYTNIASIVIHPTETEIELNKNFESNLNLFIPLKTIYKKIFRQTNNYIKNFIYDYFIE